MPQTVLAFSSLATFNLAKYCKYEDATSWYSQDSDEETNLKWAGGWGIVPDVPVGVEVSDRNGISNAAVMTSIGVLAVVTFTVASDVVICLGASSFREVCWGGSELFLAFVFVTTLVASSKPKICMAAALVTTNY